MAEFTIEQEAGAFRWRLMQGPALELARSGNVFVTYDAAREAIEDVKRAVPGADIVTPPPAGSDAVVDEASEQSFPASDPPSSWASSGGSG
jgi:uncharacterized protein YegP (UPF0339 family)